MLVASRCCRRWRRTRGPIAVIARNRRRRRWQRRNSQLRRRRRLDARIQNLVDAQTPVAAAHLARVVGAGLVALLRGARWLEADGGVAAAAVAFGAVLEAEVGGFELRDVAHVVAGAGVVAVVALVGGYVQGPVGGLVNVATDEGVWVWHLDGVLRAGWEISSVVVNGYYRSDESGD